MLSLSMKKQKAPSFSRVESFERVFPQCSVRFRAPKSNVVSMQPQETLINYDAYSADDFEQIISFGKPIEGMYLLPIYSAGWKLHPASIFGQSLGDIRCNVNLIKSDFMGVNESLFDPSSFVDFLAKIFEAESSDMTFQILAESEFDFSESIAPKLVATANSQWVKIQEVPWFYSESFEILGSKQHCSWYLPIDSTTALVISFQFWRTIKGAGSYYRSSMKTPIGPFNDTIEAFFSGFSIVLNKDCKKNLDQLCAVLEASAPRLELSGEYIFATKWATKEASAVEFQPGIGEGKKITPLEASDFIDNLLRPRPIPGSYGFDGPVTYVHHQASLSPVPLSFRKEVPPPVG